MIFLEKFKQSRHPNTICWQIEILHILTNKFTPPIGLNKVSGMTRSMERILQSLLQAASNVIENKSKDNLDSNEYQLQNVHLSPTVYEMLKRFEFSQVKQIDAEDLEESDDD